MPDRTGLTAAARRSEVVKTRRRSDRLRPTRSFASNPARAVERALLLLQLPVTAAVLGWVPGNFTKLAVMLAIWAIGFRRLGRAELSLMLAVDAIFIAANGGALRNGVFRFQHPDFLGMPVYEFFMWGFYTLHAVRVVGGRPRHFQPIATLILAALFAATFSAIRDPQLLLFVATAVVTAGLVWFHEFADFTCAGYLLAIGVVIEYVGVGTGQWAYPGAPLGGVPLWFVPMWAGIGLLTHRLLLPALAALETTRPDSLPSGRDL
jgi:hypothetical protein